MSHVVFKRLVGEAASRLRVSAERMTSQEAVRPSAENDNTLVGMSFPRHLRLSSRIPASSVKRIENSAVSLAFEAEAGGGAPRRHRRAPPQPPRSPAAPAFRAPPAETASGLDGDQDERRFSPLCRRPTLHQAVAASRRWHAPCSVNPHVISVGDGRGQELLPDVLEEPAGREIAFRRDRRSLQAQAPAGSLPSLHGRVHPRLPHHRRFARRNRRRCFPARLRARRSIGSPRAKWRGGLAARSPRCSITSPMSAGAARR